MSKNRSALNNHPSGFSLANISISSLLYLWSGRDYVGDELDSVRGEGWGIRLVTVGLGICPKVGADLDISC